MEICTWSESSTNRELLKSTDHPYNIQVAAETLEAFPRTPRRACLPALGVIRQWNCSNVYSWRAARAQGCP